MLKHVRSRASVIIFVIVLLLLLIQFGFALSEYTRHAAAALTFPFPLDYGEGPVLDQTLRLARSENIYRQDLSRPPYTVSNYPPLFLLLQVPFVKLFGPAFWYGRALSMFGVLLAAFCLGLTLYHLTGDKIAAICGGLTLLAFPYIVHWSVLNRVDSLALGLSWAGLAAIIRWPERRRGLILSGLLLSAAIYTKQSYALAAPSAACAWLFQIQARRRAWQLAAFVGGLCLGVFFLLNLLTHGGFYLNIVTANVNAFSWRTVTRYFVEITMTASYLVFGSVMFLITERLDYPTRSWPLVMPYLFAAALVGITSGKAGSWVNYLFEPAAALCLAAGAILAWAGKHYWFKAVVVCLLALQIHALATVSRERFIPMVMDKVRDAAEVSRLAQIVRDTSGYVLADEYMGLIPLAGRPLYFQPFEFSQLSAAGMWDEGVLIAAIQRREFPAILLYEPLTGSPMIINRWTKPIREAIWTNYQLQDHLAETWIYMPRK